MDRVRAPAPLRRVLPPGHRSRLAQRLGFTTRTPETLFSPIVAIATSSLSEVSQDCLVLGSMESAAGWEMGDMGDKVRHARLELYLCALYAVCSTREYRDM